jgi:uncharacterized protein YcfJ
MKKFWSRKYKEIRMKKILVGVLSVVSLSAFAQEYGTMGGMNNQNMNSQVAQVIRVEPRYVTVQQRQCQQYEVQGQDNSAAGTIIGGLAGGIIGNQVGSGRGREAATAIGAVTGAIVGNNLSARDSQPQVRESCRVVPTTVQQGRVVTFNYQGHVFSQAFPN